MNRKFFLGIILLLFAGVSNLSAQIQNPVSWEYSSKKISDDEALLTIKAQVESRWHLYGQYFDEGGPMRLTFDFEKSNNYKLIGKVKESPKPKIVHDEIFDMDVHYFSGTVSFTQKIKLLSEKPFTIKAISEGQACLDDGACVLEGEEFEIKVEGATKLAVAEENTEELEIDPDSLTTDEINSNDTSETEEAVISISDNTDNTEMSEFAIDNSDDDGSKSLWTFFLIAVGAGFITLLTPCVFPIIPMTVSFFMHDSNKSKAKARTEAFAYGLSIVLIYTLPITLLTLATAFLGSNFIEADFANTMSTHWIPNILFTLVFLIFAASFFGLFEITLPSGMVNKADKQADKGGLTGVFFMAFTLVLVSFSCTGPIVGTIIVNSLTGLQVNAGVDYSFGELLVQYGEPTIGMLGYSLGIAVPFTLFALFPKWLNSMPKSGGWLNSIKVVLGFIELALALKFLGVSDQAYHWGLLDREVYLALWIVIFALMGLYLIGKIKFAHDSELQHVSVTRLTFAILTFSFVIYLIPGMFGAPLKGLSGFLPPMSTHDFNLVEITREHSNTSGRDDGEKNKLCGTAKYSDFLHLPHGLKGYFDYEQGLACAKKQNKPLFIDFTGHGCVNCRKMEANVWSSPAVLKRLQNDYIIVTLYVDDKKELSENQWVKSTHDGRIKKTIGKINADFQVTKFNINAQPYYVLMDTNEEVLAKPRGFILDADKFVQFLDYGLEEFKKKHKE